MVTMSCVRFNTPAQRQQMTDVTRGVQADEPIAQFLGPAITESKIARLRLMAASPNSKIRETVAASYHAPEDLYEMLSHDPDPGVRQWLARNEHVPCDILRRLASDEDETVRSFVAINYFVPADAMETLSADESPRVRALADWKAALAAETNALAS
ncbi:hypothetical protein C8A06_0076 [Microbacteriaceae bacterium MWH-Ta3]|nr:hypothetical protein C8A06_0076 [Microbacteriaceae bacterium MWH-Ta3]